MEQLVLPVAPFKSEHPFVRENIAYKAVKGIDKDGMGLCYLEEVELVDGLLKARLYPTRVYQEFNRVDGKRGTLKSIHTYWERVIEHPITGVSYVVELEMVHKTNTPDMIFFCAFLGIPILGSMLNGVVRGELMGYDSQPIVDGQGNWIPDINYDTSIPANKASYDARQPTYKTITDETQV